MGFILLVIICAIILNNKKENRINALVINKDSNYLTVMAEDNNIYKLLYSDDNINMGDMLIIKYTGLLDDNYLYENTDLEIVKTNENVLLNYDNNGLFSQYYEVSKNLLKTLSLEEKISSLLLVRYDDNIDLDKYPVSGLILYSKDFIGKTAEEVKKMINDFQNKSKIPLLIGVDEEGGEVVRVSSNPFLREEKFKSSRELYEEGGFAKIKEDTLEKSALLASLGINLNLAPVVDVSTSEDDYIYPRAFGYDENLTSEYARAVIETSKNGKVSYTLKHFPTQGTDNDPHTENPVDNASIEDINNIYLKPFQAGIDAGAESVLVSHNIVNYLDDTAPASLSVAVHSLLRNTLNFSGIIITDDIAMDALKEVEDKEIKALISGNNLIITTDYVNSFNNIKKAIEDNVISEDVIDNLVLNTLAWKYYKNLIITK